ncbi:MAG TPA: hypothetical protein VNA25_19245 [Phycisphaerae bacterium]|nr:hypothetical protein [Phycisphaerae bacterium]HUT59986.1 hypothetical protein [Phycisphaerae bacterium]
MIWQSTVHSVRCGALALTASERADAMGSWSSSWGVLLWALLTVIIVGLVVFVSAGMILRRRRVHRQTRQSLEDRFRQAGLSGPERKLLVRLAKQAGLESPEAIFTIEQTFEAGANDLLTSQAFLAMSTGNQGQVSAVMNSLRQKLGFGASPNLPTGQGVSTRSIPQGAELTLTDLRSGESFDVIVETVEPEALIVRILTQVGAAISQRLQGRYSNLGCAWEFDTEATPRGEDRIALGHTDRIRLINRRRFARVPIRGDALLAELDFFQEGAEPRPLELAQSTVVAIAGPGLLLETTLRATLRSKVLVIAQLSEGMVIRGVAKVRRVEAIDDEKYSVAVELMDLLPEEISELTRQTNLAAQRRAQPTAGEPTKELEPTAV